MQLSYEQQKRAFAGMKGDMCEDKVTTLSSQARHGFGLAICLAVVASNELRGKLPALSTDITDLKVFRGFALHSHVVESGYGDSLAPGYLPKTPISVMEKGDGWVVVSEDVTPASPVACNFGNADAGKFCTTTGANAALVPNARYRSPSITVDGVKIALLELY